MCLPIWRNQCPKERVQEILNGQQGLLPITGQIGTGKTTTLLVIAYQAWQQGIPIAVFTEDQATLASFEQYSIPQEWAREWVQADKQKWLDAVASTCSNPNVAILIDRLSGSNDQAARLAAKSGHWVFTCLDTPFVGIDVFYNLRSRGFTNQDILKHVAGIVSQMLLPRLCSDCTQLVPASLEETQLIYPGACEFKDFWREVGCSNCSNRGVKGRCLAFEVLNIDNQITSYLEDYLNHSQTKPIPQHYHFTIRDSARDLIKSGLLGVKSYQAEVLRNPLLRIQHLWEKENLRATHIQNLFSRFVTQQLVDRLVSQQELEQVIKGEKRYITCFFCDIRGFTTRSEASSPTEIFKTLNIYFDEIIEIVFKYEGTIDKFIGDSVMVVFGAPIQQSDQELRAINCAIEIQQKVAEINQYSKTAPVHIGIGINSGEAIAGCLGNSRRMDYTVLGDAVNIAARLESQAKPGQILISLNTYQTVKEDIECCSLGSIELKGKSKLVDVFEVLC